MHHFLKKQYSKSQRPFISVPSDYSYFNHKTSNSESSQRKKVNFNKLQQREVNFPNFEKASQLTRDKKFRESNAVLKTLLKLGNQSLYRIYYHMAINYREMNDYQQVLACINEFLYYHSDNSPQAIVDKFLVMKKRVNQIIKNQRD